MTIVIDGNIGAGKSTQLDLLESLGYSVKKEPVDDWPLDKFYQNNSKWAFLFQMAVLHANLVPSDCNIDFIERGILPGRMVFWEDMMNRGIVEHSEEHYWYDKLWNSLKWYPDIYIFINTSPSVAMGRIEQRYQVGDRYIKKETLERLHLRYIEMLDIIKHDCKVFIVDGDNERQKIHDDILKIIQDHSNK